MARLPWGATLQHMGHLKQVSISTCHTERAHNFMRGCMQVCHHQLLPCWGGEHIWRSTLDQNRVVFLKTCHNGNKKFNLSACQDAALNKLNLWLCFRSLILFCHPGQPKLLCKNRVKATLSASRFYGSMFSEWLQGSVFFQSSGLSLFLCQAPFYQDSPNWLISRCLYRDAGATCTLCIICQFHLGNIIYSFKWWLFLFV